MSSCAKLSGVDILSNIDAFDIYIEDNRRFSQLIGLSKRG